MKNQVGMALALMCEVFKNVVDRGGNPYSGHCIRVWQGVINEPEPVQVAAILHDVVEDTDYTLDDLRVMGFSVKALILLNLVTHWPEDSYQEYIEKCATMKETALIKMSDLKDNMDPTRLKGATAKDEKRIGKYANAYYYLSKL